MSTNALYFGSAGLVSLVAFTGLILAPAIKAYGRWPERVAAGLLSLLILGALVTIGVLVGLAWTLESNDVTGVFPWFS